MLPDDHDALYLLTHSLVDQSSDSYKMSEEERLRYEKEFKDYQDQLNKDKEE